MLSKVRELVERNDLKKEGRSRMELMLNETIDVTAFWGWFVGNYPESMEIMRKNPDYQSDFI
jgi:hypothetical protein